MNKALRRKLLFLFLSALLILAVIFPQTAQAQIVRNALTAAGLQAGNFLITGIFKFTGPFFVPSGTTLPGTCDASVSGASRFFFRATDNSIYFCTATNTWTGISSGSLANPYAVNQGFSGAVTFTGTVSLPRQQILEVCKAGCPYSTVASAVAAISDASTTKRYAITVGPGNYDENVTAISYLTLRGTSKEKSRIRGSSGITVTVPVGITEFEMENITIGGATALSSTGAESPRTVVRLRDVILGIIDGTESASGKTTSCLLDTGSVHDYVNSNVTCRSTVDGFRISTDDTLTGTGTVVTMATAGSASMARGWSWSNTGAQIVEMSPNLSITKDGSAGAFAVQLNTSTNSGTRVTKITFMGGSFVLASAAGVSAQTIGCADFASAIGAQQAGTEVVFNGVNCDLTDSNNTWTLNGIRHSGIDSDYNNVTMRWNGGRIRLSGGATARDVQKGSNLSILMMTVDHSGTYSSATAVGIETLAGRYTLPGAWTIGSTGSLTDPTLVKTVCSSGCDFTTLTAALAAITDSSPTKRYRIAVSAGTYSEAGDSAAKAYVSVVGAGRTNTLISGINFTMNGAKEFSISHLTVNSGGGWIFKTFSNDAAGPWNFYADDFGCGDTTAPIADCVLDQSTGGHNFYITNSYIVTALEAYFLAANDSVVEMNTHIQFLDNITAPGYQEVNSVFTNGAEVGSPTTTSPSNGAFIYSVGQIVTGVLAQATASGTPFFRYLDMRGATGTVYGPFVALVKNASIDVSTASTGTWPLSGIYLGDVGTNSNISMIDFQDVTLNMTASAGTHPMTGIEIGTTDADHANYRIRWHGGKLTMGGAGAGALADVANSDNTAGLEVMLDGLNHSATYSGTIAPTYQDRSVGLFSKKLTIPTVAGSAPTVSGQISYDTTGNNFTYGDNGTNRLVANLDEAQSFTNKTIDVEATGNLVTTVEKRWLQAAQCQNATATILFDTPTTNAPQAACVTGTNTQKAYLDFDPTTAESAQAQVLLPTDWTGAIDATFDWLTTATTGNVAWCLQIICVADAETDDPAFPAVAAGNCISDAAKGTTNQTNTATKTGITASSCAAGELAHLRISRDPAEVSGQSDTVANDARLIGVLLTYRRAQ